MMHVFNIAGRKHAFSVDHSLSLVVKFSSEAGNSGKLPPESELTIT